MDDIRTKLFVGEERSARRFGKSTMNIAMAKFYLDQGRKVLFMTVNQRETITMLARHFPKALFEVVGEQGVAIHEIKRTPLCLGCHDNRSNPPSVLCSYCKDSERD